jgi:hypothetical protein
MKQLKSIEEIEEAKPQISEVYEDDFSGRAIFVCKGNVFFMVGVTERGWEAGEEECGIETDNIEAIFNPLEAYAIGLITAEEKNDWEERLEEFRKKAAKIREDREREEYLKLKAKYEPNI